jgi:formyltetrahydrofolate-dependent phosphoribosylglycinamide formyltransferase
VTAPRKRVAVLISGRGSNMSALIAAARAPDYPAEIAFVLSNRPDAAGLAVAAAEGIPTLALDHRAFVDREAFERAMQGELLARDIDLVCLAGFMRLLSPSFVGAWEGRMINIHPALLPAFKGLHTHERALAAGVALHGCTAHLVTAGMDEGPVLAQAALAVAPGDTPDTLAARVLRLEHAIYPLALRWLAEGVRGGALQPPD